MAPRRTRRIVVTAIGTPPALPLRPFVDEVLRALDEARARRVTLPDAVAGSRGVSALPTRHVQPRAAAPTPQRVGRDRNARGTRERLGRGRGRGFGQQTDRHRSEPRS